MASFPELSEIKAARRRLGITQAQLSEKAGVSQSLIAKVESGRLTPGYSIVQKIFSALEETVGSREVTAGEVMRKHLFSVSPSDSIREAASIMRKHAFSQLPVMEKGVVVGLVTETILLDALAEGKAGLVREVMAEAPPIVPRNASASALIALLKLSPIVVVAEGGRVVGLIAKADLLDRLYSR